MTTFAEPALAFDREPQPSDSTRTKDAFGRLHVSMAHISKACVNEYIGHEIPNWQALGLERDRRYKLLRDPDELSRAASTFNNVPLLSTHRGHSAASHQPDLVIGSTGTDAVFNFPFLDNSLVVWPQPDIEKIEDDLKRELSCSYAYRPDLSPGVFEGESYEIVMRDIVGNHVAVVSAGRAGSEVLIGDSKPADQPNLMECFIMPTTVLSRKALLVQGASLGYLAPKLAADAKSIDLTKVFANVTAANFKASKATIAAALADTVKGKLAADAKLDDYQTFLGAFDAMDPEEDKPKAKDEEEETEEEKEAREKREKKEASDKKARDKKAKDARKAFDAKQAADRKAFDAENPFAKKDDDDKKADDEEEDDDDKKKKKAEDAEEDDKVSKAAMDAAIGSVAKSTEARIVARMRGAREAEQFVRPWVGELAVAYDSAEEILRATAIALKVPDAATIHASALKTLIGLMPKPGEVRGGGQRLANDSVRTADAEAEFRKMFPEAGKAPRRV